MMVNWEVLWDKIGVATISLTDHFKTTATNALFIIITIILLLIVVRILFKWIKNRGRRESLNLEQKEWLRIGGYNVRKKKLRNLFGSVTGNKLTNFGRIVSYVEIENKTEKESEEIIEKWVLIGVTSDIIKFYYLPLTLFQIRKGDVIISEWNFVLDKTGRYYVKNTYQTEELDDEKDSELKTLQALSKYTLDAIKSNPIHKTRLRERHLANTGQESNWQMMGGK